MVSASSGADTEEQQLDTFSSSGRGRAGDLIIWHDGLPHGASPNGTDRPRIVQYITIEPSPAASRPGQMPPSPGLLHSKTITDAYVATSSSTADTGRAVSPAASPRRSRR